MSQVNVPALQKIMVEFARENERSELTGELIGDTLDDALANDGDAEAEDKIVSQVGTRADFSSYAVFLEVDNYAPSLVSQLLSPWRSQAVKLSHDSMIASFGNNPKVEAKL